jgi:site-specific recombinase XerD
VSLLDVQKILGHHSILTTLRYTHLTKEGKANTIIRINALMNRVTISWGNVL